MGTLVLSRAQVIEQKTVTHLVAILNGAGWAASAIDDSGDEPVIFASNAEILPAVFAAQDSWIIFKSANGRSHSVHLVPGNGAEIIAECTQCKHDIDGFGALVDSVTEWAGYL